MIFAKSSINIFMPIKYWTFKIFFYLCFLLSKNSHKYYVLPDPMQGNLDMHPHLIHKTISHVDIIIFMLQLKK